MEHIKMVAQFLVHLIIFYHLLEMKSYLSFLQKWLSENSCAETMEKWWAGPYRLIDSEEFLNADGSSLPSDANDFSDLYVSLNLILFIVNYWLDSIILFVKNLF